MTHARAHYMAWSKGRRPAPYDLAASNLLACTIDDLPGGREALSFEGTNEDGYEPLLERIAFRYGVGVEQVATAHGCSGANFLVCLALLQPGDEVLVERPAYDPLLAVPQALGARVARLDRRFEDGYRIDADRIRAALTSATRLVALTSPHNPSGVRIAAEDLDRLADLAAARQVYVLFDEVYLDVAVPDPVVTAARRSPWFITTSSLTKSYGLNALRCGWALGAPEVIEKVRRARDLVDAIGAVPLDRLAALAFDQLDVLAGRARAIAAANAAALEAFLAGRRDLSWVPTGGATVVFPRLNSGADTSALADRLLQQHGVAIVPGRFFEAPDHFRLALGGEPGMVREALRRIAAALGEGDR